MASRNSQFPATCATCNLPPATCHLPPLKQKLFTFAKIAISLGLIAYVFSKVHVEAVLASLASANPWLILLALAFYVLAIFIGGVKWNVLLRALDVRVPFSSVLQYMFVGFFFNNVFPANIGGDVMRGDGMACTTDRTADAAVSVVVDRLVGLLAYMSTAAVMAIVVITVMGIPTCAGCLTWRWLHSWSW